MTNPPGAHWYNLFMHPVIHRLMTVFFLIFLLVGCTPISLESQGLNSTQVTLVPYRTTVVTPVLTEGSTTAILPSSTPEPIIYTVVAGDSLSSIAFRFGVELNTLILANPGVNANAMPIGMKLVIPPVGDAGEAYTSSMTGLPTPVINSDVKPDCYPLEDGQWICFLLIHNSLNMNIGNITGQVKTMGSPVIFTAACPLDMVLAGETIPLIAWINGIEIDPEAMTGSLTSAVTLDQAEARYEGVSVTPHAETYPIDRRSVIIDGTLTPPESGNLRVLAYAQDNQGHVIGFRVWESSDSVSSGLAQSFQIHLYSLAGAITSVHLLAQIRLE
jgi:LysM repeat protein